MLLAVAQMQARGGTLVVEAGTGTGKSLAYLGPSIARGVRHGERVVVSTNTHTLQEQLMVKDLPGLREWLPWDFKACLLKGRSNYVSLRRWRRFLAEPCKDPDDLKFKLKVMLWLHTTSSGDRSELRLHGREEVDGPGLLALLERLGGDGPGLLTELRRQPHLGSSEEAFGEAMPMSLAAGQRVRELFDLATRWVGAKLAETERRDDSVRLTPPLREDEEWPSMSIAAENAVTALTALDAVLRKALAGVRDWLGGSEPDQGIRDLELIRARLDVAAHALDEALTAPDPNRVDWITPIAP